MKRKYLFTVNWERGSINDNIIEVLKRKGIKFMFNHYFQLIANVYGDDIYHRFNYEHVHDNIYGISIIE